MSELERVAREPVPLYRRTITGSGMAGVAALVDAARRIIVGALCVVAGQKVLIIASTDRLDIASALLSACRDANADATLLVLEQLQDRPHTELHSEIRERLAWVEASVFIASAEKGESQMRRELISRAKRCNVRHAHMVGVTMRAMNHGFCAEPRRIANVAGLLFGSLRPSSVLQVRSASGTSLIVKTGARTRWVEHSGVIRRGRWENLPAGEIITCPLDVNGVFVADGTMSELWGCADQRLKDNPIIVEFRDGCVREVHCANGRLARDVKEWMLSGQNYDRVGLVGLGTNVGISEPIGEVICDQNIPGLHISLGSTFSNETGATWDTDDQLLLTAFNQNVDLDGRPVIRSGRFL